MRKPELTLAVVFALLGTLSPLPLRADPGFGHGRGSGRPENPGRPGNPGRGHPHGRSQVGRPNARGNGCPPGTVSATLSPDESTVSLIFDNYVVEAGRNAGRNEDRKVCEIEVPMTIPPGFRVVATRVDYRGFNALPDQGKSAFRFQFGIRTVREKLVAAERETNFRGPLNEEFLISQDASRFVSGCGEPFSLTMVTSLRVHSNPNREQALATIDSADLTASRDTTKYFLDWEECAP